MDRPTTEQPATEQPATLSDEELQEVAAGAGWQIDYGASLSGFASHRPRSSDWWRDDSATLTGGSSGGSGLT